VDGLDGPAASQATCTANDFRYPVPKQSAEEKEKQRRERVLEKRSYAKRWREGKERYKKKAMCKRLQRVLEKVVESVDGLDGPAASQATCTANDFRYPVPERKTMVEFEKRVAKNFKNKAKAKTGKTRKRAVTPKANAKGAEVLSRDGRNSLETQVEESSPGLRELRRAEEELAEAEQKSAASIQEADLTTMKMLLGEEEAERPRESDDQDVKTLQRLLDRDTVKRWLSAERGDGDEEL
jgi:hypothetical protein